MKKIFAVTAVVAAAASAQLASAQEVSPFDGPYVGVQINAARTQDKHTDLDYWYYGLADARNEKTNVQGGIRAGYDFTSGALIAGALAEVSFGTINTVREISPVDPSYAIGSRIKTLGSVRAKLGVNTGNLAAFLTGGVAFSDNTNIYNETDGSGQYYVENGGRTGYVLGAGVSYFVSPKVSVGLDYSHYQFGAETHELRSSNGTPNGNFFRQRDRVDSIGFNLNYHF